MVLIVTFNNNTIYRFMWPGSVGSGKAEVQNPFSFCYLVCFHRVEFQGALEDTFRDSHHDEDLWKVASRVQHVGPDLGTTVEGTK